MIDKLCVCGHEMKPQGKQTLEMNGSSLGSNLWTDHVPVEVYICSWCGRMAFFEPDTSCPESLCDRARYDGYHFPFDVSRIICLSVCYAGTARFIALSAPAGV